MATQTRIAIETTVGKTKLVAEPGKQEIVITRLFDAPRDRLFKAYTDPDLIPKWWGGPGEGRTTVKQLELRPGGIWRFVERDVQGKEFGFHGVYHEVVTPERVVNTFEYEGEPGHVVLDTATFEERNGKTLLTQHSVFQSVEDRDGMLQSGMEEGVNAGMDRLEALVSEA
jgi:uncharacterized protein YndB with AHSA1/START domain